MQAYALGDPVEALFEGGSDGPAACLPKTLRAKTLPKDRRWLSAKVRRSPYSLPTLPRVRRSPYSLPTLSAKTLPKTLTLFEGGSEWYPGNISAINADGTYGIAYHDDDHEDSVLATNMRCLVIDGSGAGGAGGGGGGGGGGGDVGGDGNGEGEDEGEDEDEDEGEGGFDGDSLAGAVGLMINRAQCVVKDWQLRTGHGETYEDRLLERGESVEARSSPSPHRSNPQQPTNQPNNQPNNTEAR